MHPCCGAVVAQKDVWFTLGSFNVADTSANLWFTSILPICREAEPCQELKNCMRYLSHLHMPICCWPWTLTRSGDRGKGMRDMKLWALNKNCYFPAPLLPPCGAISSILANGCGAAINVFRSSKGKGKKQNLLQRVQPSPSSTFFPEQTRTVASEQRTKRPRLFCSTTLMRLKKNR